MALCDEIKEKISLYIEGEVDEKEKSEIELHIKVCNDCSKYYYDMKKIISGLNDTEEIDVPSEVHDNIINEVKKISDSSKKNRFKEMVPAAACLIIMCVVTFTLTDMQNKKALQQQTDSQQPLIEARNGNTSQPVQTYEKKTGDIIIENLTVTINADNTEDNLNKVYEIAEFYDPETVLNKADNILEFKILKYDIDSFMEKANSIGNTSISEKSQTDKTEEYNSIFEELDKADKHDINTINSLTEQAFFIETDMDYYFIKIVLENL